MSGRWCPLEVIGEGETPDGFEEILFENILKEIRRGGGPIRYLPMSSRPSEADARAYHKNANTGMGAITHYSVPKWNQFWSSTADAWLFAGDGTIPPGIGGDGDTPLVIDPNTLLSGIATVNFESSEGPVTDLTHAPAPSYDNEEEFGFIGGGN